MELKQKRALFITGIAVLSLLIFGIVNILAHQGKVHLEIIVSPQDSSLTIDGQPARPGKIWLTKGTHTLKASRQHFTDVTRVIDTNKLDPDKPVYILPGADSSEAQQYLIDHPEDQQLRESAGSQKDVQVQEKLQDQKLLNLLPFIAPGFEFQIDYDATSNSDGDVQLTIYIEADTDAAKQSALDWIKSQGVNPDSLHIVYQQNDAIPGSTEGTGRQ
jgi:hypothetical protein